MLALKILFWVSLTVLFYSYLGYGILLLVIRQVRRFTRPNKMSNLINDFEPEVSIVVAAYNEEDIIEQKIHDCLLLDYPKSKLKIIFIADGSSDRTPQIISGYPEVKLLFTPERQGKVAAVNRAMQYVRTPFVVFCDANTFLNRRAIKELVKHFADENVGAVAGEKKVVSTDQTAAAASSGEGLYWRYESILKTLDSDFYTVVGAAGELFSIRTNLYEPVSTDVLLDDFIISMKICMNGYRVVYEPKAFASESPSFSMKEEQKRKIRISAGGFQSVIILSKLLNIFRYGKLAFQYISHRVLRWVVCPIMLPVLFVCNFLLCYYTSSNMYLTLFVAQLLFYVAAGIGFLYAEKNIKIKSVYIPYYFVFMNFALYLGLKRFINKEQSVLWDKAVRK